MMANTSRRNQPCTRCGHHSSSVACGNLCGATYCNPSCARHDWAHAHALICGARAPYTGMIFQQGSSYQDDSLADEVYFVTKATDRPKPPVRPKFVKLDSNALLQPVPVPDADGGAAGQLAKVAGELSTSIHKLTEGNKEPSTQ